MKLGPCSAQPAIFQTAEFMFDFLSVEHFDIVFPDGFCRVEVLLKILKNFLRDIFAIPFLRKVQVSIL